MPLIEPLSSPSPILGYFLGKRRYCSWACGCGGFANTFGEPRRHFSDKSAKSWRFEKVSVHTVLGITIVTTIVVRLNWAIGKSYPQFSAFAFQVQQWCGFRVGAILHQGRSGIKDLRHRRRLTRRRTRAPRRPVPPAC